jgi:hypothetical protein
MLVVCLASLHFSRVCAAVTFLMNKYYLKEKLNPLFIWKRTLVMVQQNSSSKKKACKQSGAIEI